MIAYFQIDQNKRRIGNAGQQHWYVKVRERRFRLLLPYTRAAKAETTKRANEEMLFDEAGIAAETAYPVPVASGATWFPVAVGYDAAAAASVGAIEAEVGVASAAATTTVFVEPTWSQKGNLSNSS